MHHWRTNILGSATTTKKAILVDGEVAGNIVSWDAAEKRKARRYECLVMVPTVA
jgi:hypothetical protein